MEGSLMVPVRRGGGGGTGRQRFLKQVVVGLPPRLEGCPVQEGSVEGISQPWQPKQIKIHGDQASAEAGWLVEQEAWCAYWYELVDS